MYVACLLSVCHCLFSDYARQYLLKMGGQLDKRTGNPPHVVYFSCSLLSVTWRIKYYYYYYNVCLPSNFASLSIKYYYYYYYYSTYSHTNTLMCFNDEYFSLYYVSKLSITMVMKLTLSVL